MVQLFILWGDRPRSYGTIVYFVGDRPRSYRTIVSSPVGSLCHTPGVVRRESSVSTITTRYN